MTKNVHAQQLDNSVATPTPSTSMPPGNSTNMNSGSRMMFRIPPIAIPNPAFEDSPTLRRRFAMTFDRTVGMPPSTMTQNEYCRAYAKVLPLAPRSSSIGFIKSSIPMEKTAVVPAARYMLKAETRLASPGSSAPRSLEMSAPPPMPASPARDRQILNTGRISDTPATMKGLFVLPK